MDLLIRPRTPDDDARSLEIRSAIYHDRPPLTVEERRHWLATVSNEDPPVMMVVERDGRIVATAGWNRRLFVKEPDSFWLDISVDPALWGQGIGSRVYDSEMPRIVARGARRVFGTVREDLPRAEAFVRARGFERTGYGDRISRLDVRSANLERCRAAARRVQESGIRIASLAELQPDETLLRAICDVDNTSAEHMPTSTEYKPVPFEEWKKFALEGPGYSHETFWVAMNGDVPVGLAFLQMRAGNIADNAYTGVDPAHHGRGIARALKLRTVEWAQAHSVAGIITGNDPSNAAMLAINIDLGYQPLPANVEVVKEL